MNSSNDCYLDHDFDPLKFHEDYYEHDIGRLEKLTQLAYDVYNSDKLKGDSLLDLGTGPSIHWLAAPSQNYTDITVSDLVDFNLNTLKNWLRKGPDTIKYTSLKWAAKAENISDPSIIEERIRKAVKHVVPCDLLNEIPLLNITRQYDVVQSTYALDSAARGHSLKGIIQNMSNHLKPGGALVMLNTIGATYWEVGPHKYPKYTLSPEALEDALTEAGFEYIQLNVHFQSKDSKLPCDFIGTVMSCAFKKY